MRTQACMFTTFLSVTYALFLYPKGGENMNVNEAAAAMEKYARYIRAFPQNLWSIKKIRQVIF